METEEINKVINILNKNGIIWSWFKGQLIIMGLKPQKK